MAELFWQHPLGHPTTVPCRHNLVRQHPDGHVVLRRRVECNHWVRPHANDPGPTMPCVHPMRAVRTVPFGPPQPPGTVVFFTDDNTIQQAVIDGVQRIRSLNINFPGPRPLNVFHRDPVNGDPNDGGDPFWNRYHPQNHSIQITRGSLSGTGLTEMVHHELGHALLGHSCVMILGSNGQHNFTQAVDPGLAMSEGWADFVALVIEMAANNLSPTYGGLNWESMSLGPAANVEYCVGCCLWDLYDTIGEGGRNPDRLVLSFQELFRVFSPTLATLSDGPIIPDIHNYLTRLRQNNPNWRRALIGEIERRHVGS